MCDHEVTQAEWAEVEGSKVAMNGDGKFYYDAFCYDWEGKIDASTGPLGVESGVKCVRRGGCWGGNDTKNDCAISDRGTARVRSYRSAYGGLRVVCTVN